MKTVEELRRDLSILAESDAEVAALIGRIRDKQISWERAALHLYLEIAGDVKPAKKATKQAQKG